MPKLQVKVAEDPIPLYTDIGLNVSGFSLKLTKFTIVRGSYYMTCTRFPTSDNNLWGVFNHRGETKTWASIKARNSPRASFPPNLLALIRPKLCSKIINKFQRITWSYNSHPSIILPATHRNIRHIVNNEYFFQILWIWVFQHIIDSTVYLL